MTAKDLPTIHSQFHLNIEWEKSESKYTLNSQDVHVWKIKVPEHFCHLLKEYRSVLTKNEFLKAQKFYWEKDFRSYITRRIILRILLSQYLNVPASQIQFDPAKGKPSIISAQPLKYNLSCSGVYILISIGRCETGVDIENINDDFSYSDLLVSCFDNREIKNIRKDLEQSSYNFFLQWTRKEALLKYTGQGIIENLKTIPSLNGTHSIRQTNLEMDESVNLTSFKIDFNCVGSLAFPTYVSNVKYIEW